MIPADVASRLQISADTTLRPVAPTQEISDKLSGLVAGQRVMAEIQAMLPNGTYRAMINQRNITLALPFSAKSGDSLELMVTENDGKLALAVMARPGGEGKGAATPDSASATLSRTGQLIGALFSGARGAREGGNAVPLNANRPILAAPPGSAAELAPLLKQAISQSGLFYEAHQVEWFAGRFAKADLLQEPQGKLSSPATLAEAEAEALPASRPTTASTPPAEGAAKTSVMLGEKAGEAPSLLRPGGEPTPAATTEAGKGGATTPTPASPSATPSAAQLIAPQLQNLVQQQLEALATQHFVWQGQAWPGQEMRWEIDEDAARQTPEGEAAAAWSTRMRLSLPHLGEVDARIRLQGNLLSVSIAAAEAATCERLRAAGQGLSQSLEDAGLTLGTLGVEALLAAAEGDDGAA